MTGRQTVTKSIPQKSFLVLLLPIIVCAMTLVMALYGSSQSAKIARAQGGAGRRGFLLSEIRRAEAERSIILAALLANPADAALRDQAKRELVGMADYTEAALRQYELEMPFPPPVILVDHLDQLRRMLENNDTIIGEIEALLDTGDRKGAEQLSAPTWSESRRRFDSFMEEWAARTQHEAENMARHAETIQHNLSVILPLSVLPGLFISLLAAYLVARNIVRQLRGLSSRLQEAGVACFVPDAAGAADLAEIAAELSAMCGTSGSAANGAPDGDGRLDRQYQAWSALPSDVRTALLILAKRFEK